MVYVHTSGEGKGLDYRDALDDALSDAVARVNGIEIGTTTRAQLAELVVGQNGKLTGVTAEAYASSVDTRTKGVLKSYKIVSNRTDPRGFTRIQVEAEVSQYEAKESNRLRLAVIPFALNDVGTAPTAGTPSVATIRRRLSLGLVNLLTSSRKFAILEREFDSSRQAELQRLSAGRVPATERARLGQEIGADYVLVGSVEAFQVSERPMSLANGTAGITISVNLAVSYRVVDLASGATVLAQTAKVESATPVLGGIPTMDGVIEDTSKEASAQISSRILETIYPLRVISTGEELTLSMGGEALHEGQKMKIYNLGKRLEDPDTGEYLGREEVFVADAQVTRVLPKVAYASVQDGKGAIAQGAICRLDRPLPSKPDPEQTPSNIKKELYDLFK
jgi:curli biogenesis system outer membrane secretion channel CsgG